MIQETTFQPGYPRGEYQDILIGPQGEIIWERPWQHNTILAGMSKLLAALIKGDTINGKPLGYWAVGTGKHNKDALANITDLKAPVLKKEIKPWNMTYIGGTSHNQLAKTIEITMDFSIDDFNTNAISLTEFGLFSQSNFLINYHSHKAIEIKIGFTLRRKLHLIF